MNYQEFLENKKVTATLGGLMTVPYIAMQEGRQGFATELNQDYFADGVAHLRRMEHKLTVPTLWDLVEMEPELETV